jgi:hypothetical protein
MRWGRYHRPWRANVRPRTFRPPCVGARRCLARRASGAATHRRERARRDRNGTMVNADGRDGRPGRAEGSGTAGPLRGCRRQRRSWCVGALSGMHCPPCRGEAAPRPPRQGRSSRRGTVAVWCSRAHGNDRFPAVPTGPSGPTGQRVAPPRETWPPAGENLAAPATSCGRATVSRLLPHHQEALPRAERCVRSCWLGNSACIRPHCAPPTGGLGFSEPTRLAVLHVRGSTRTEAVAMHGPGLG